jgi:hypothetical protein
MKITVTFKDPDVVEDAINEAALAECAAIPTLSEPEVEALAERRAEPARKALGHWIRWGEYVSIEFDTDAMTATVKENKE